MNSKIFQVLKEQFGFNSFRDGQEETIKKLLAGNNILAVLPTGAGKSLLYQLPAYLMPGSVLIVSPLISLMQDQVDRLRRRGEKRVVMLNGQLTGQERKQVLTQLSSFKFIFTSPETLAHEEVIAALQQVPLSLMVIDEAHCISQWGPDFRPEYLLLKKIHAKLADPVTLLLTATATPAVRQDIIKKLGFELNEIQQVIRSVNRPNILMAVKKFPNQEAKDEELLQLIKRFSGAGIIYFASRKLATQMAKWLANHSNRTVAAYHAGIATVERFRIQEQFMTNQVQLICATSAFGMGIDKNDIRFVIHYHMPSNLESYIQEIGRAGRDGQQSVAVLLYTAGDEQIQRRLTQFDLPSKEILAKVQAGELPASVLGEQGDLFTFYLSHRYNPEQIIIAFNQRQKQLNTEIYQMLDYIMANTCRRNLILNYFGENSVQAAKNCCDIDNSSWEEQIMLPPSVEVKRTYLSWQQRLDHLLKVAKK